MRSRSMRFENNSRERSIIDADNFDELARVARPADDPHGRTRHSAQLSQETDDLLVRLPMHRWRGYIEFPGIAQAAGEARLFCAGLTLSWMCAFSRNRLAPGDVRSQIRDSRRLSH